MMRLNFFKKRKEEPVKVLELFGGIGAFTLAMRRVGIPFEVVDYVEIDKFACKSYNAMYGTNFEPQDICDWDKDIEADFIMHGSPCQDFSVAGRGAGGDEGSGTRSSLMYETIRIVEKLKPKYVLWENVKNVTGKKHRHNFDKYLVSLQQLGYNNYWQIMNAKDYGIPQNRERVFVLSIRRDIDKGYEFPEPFPLQLRLKDMLDAEVDESFYISDERTKSLQRDLINKDTLMLDVCQYKREGHPREYNEVSPTLSARDYKDPRLIQVGNLDIKGQDIVKRVYSSDGLSPTLTNMQGGNRQPKVAYVGEPTEIIGRRAREREASKCKYCDRVVGRDGAFGMCNKHYQMYRLHGDALHYDNRERATSNGYYRTGKSGQHEHRKIYEDYYGIKLKPEQIIHHINFVRTDNRIENLYCYDSRSEHQRVHNAYRRLLKECSAEDIEFKDGMYQRKSV